MVDLTLPPTENYNRSPFIRHDPLRRRYLYEPIILTVVLTIGALLVGAWFLNENKVLNAGQTVDLLLDSSDFSKVQTGTVNLNKRAIKYVFGFSILFPLSSGIWCILRLKKKGRCQWLMKHGQEIEAQIVEELRQATKYAEENNDSIRRKKGGTHIARALSTERYWRLSYRDPSTGQSWSFLSFFGNFPEDFNAVGKYAKVFVDPSDFHNYYVDLKTIRDPSIVQNPPRSRKNIPTW